ncbi:MAG: ABC transporter substrate-binding protein [Formivibrio sp.]|nr:ABC transporter substrate-binding protein [Formivibrio sp.]
MKKMKWLLVLVVALVSGGVLAASNEAPEQIVRNVSRDVLDIIKKNDKDTAKVRDLVDSRVAPLADYGRMTKLAVGRYWSTASAEQQQALIREFRQMLVRTYLSALTIYKNAQVEVKGSRAGNSSDEMNVRSEVNLAGQKPIPLDFSFEKTDAGWKVYDISVEGISFINNHRNQFSSIIQKEGIDGLIKQLSDRNTGIASSK